MKILQKEALFLLAGYFAILTVLFFIFSHRINFFQNDDWIFYQNVQSFLSGNFNLHPLTAPVFYAQGIIGAAFASIFGLEKLPILTLIVSVSSIYIFAKILTDHLGYSVKSAFIISMLFLFNPLFFYSILGFMTENFFLFFLLLSTYFFINAIKTDKKSSNFAVVLTVLSMFLAFFVRQVGIILPVSAGIFLLIRKNKKSTIFFLSSVFLISIYLIYIPKTQEMIDKPVSFSLIFSPSLITLLSSFIYYFSAFMFPLIFIAFLSINAKKLNDKWVIISIIISVVIFILITSNLIRGGTGIREFPYILNTFTRKGFYPYGLVGNKYHFIGYYDLFNMWQYSAAFTSFIFIFISVFSLKKLKDFVKKGWGLIFALNLLVYMFLMAITPAIFDRYVLPVLFIGGLLILSQIVSTEMRKLLVVITIPVIIFYIIINYQFGLDFIKSNKLIWEDAMVTSSSVRDENITATHAWNSMNKVNVSSSVVIYSHDKPANFDLISEYELEKELKVDFTGSFFIDPLIYKYIRAR